jgi:muramoyltetrapeptide carboxypeptidase
MTFIPPYLSPGDYIGIVCPAGYMPLDKIRQCVSTLEQWGFRVKIGKTVGGPSLNYFSGTDEERLKDLQQMLDDKSVKAVLCARGGYGIGRIIEEISFRQFKKSPKWIVGYSDVTLLHAHIYSNYRISTLHAPMAAAFNSEPQPDEFTTSLKEALMGIPTAYACDKHDFNRLGNATAELVGGNLTLLAHAVGSSSDLKTKGRLLFLEDTGEYLYNIDRMLHQLKRAGKLDRLAGLMVGSFTAVKDTERPFGKTAGELIRDLVREFDYPVCFGFPVGHSRENLALKTGIPYHFGVSASGTKLEQA